MFNRYFSYLHKTVQSQSRGIKQKILKKMSGKRFLHKLNHNFFNDRQAL